MHEVLHTPIQALFFDRVSEYNRLVYLISNLTEDTVWKSSSTQTTPTHLIM